MKRIEIVPLAGTRLYDALIRKEADIRAAGRGTFFRAGPARKNSATWKHKAYPGQVALSRSPSQSIAARIRTANRSREWQMLSAFLGFVDRHFGDNIASITILYS